MKSAELVTVGPRHVTIKEGSGLLSLYVSWQDVFKRNDADTLCIDYLKKLNKCSDIVRKQLALN